MKEMMIHTWLKNQIKNRYGKQAIYIKAPAGVYSSRRGISDFIYCIKGCFIAIEVKVPGNKPTLIQENFLKEVTDAGGLALVLTGKDESIFEKIDQWVTMHNDPYSGVTP